MSEPLAKSVNSANDNRTIKDKFRQCLRFFRRLCAQSIWVLVAIGLLLRFTVRDRYLPWAVIYYVTPIPALPIWLLIAGAFWGRSSAGSTSRFPLARLNLLFALGFVVWTAWSEDIDRAQPTRPDELRLVFWNTAHGLTSVNRCATYLRSLNAPVIALVEADERVFVVEKWIKELPEYHVAGTHFGGLLAVQGLLKKQIKHQLSVGSWCDQFDLIVGEDDFTVLLVDIYSNLNWSRREPLQSLAELVEQLADRPVIIMGDFNTPDDSIWFAPLRQVCRQAFRERGVGYAATWPMPLPVLTLDQVWVNDLVSPSRCEHAWTVFSDHRPVISSVSFHRSH